MNEFEATNVSTGLIVNQNIFGGVHEKMCLRGICGQRMPRSACAFAQSDQGLRCPLTES